MMKKLSCVLLAALVSAAHADDATIVKKLKDFGLQQVEISDSPIKGLRSVVTDQGIFYSSPDGRYLLQGNLVELKGNGNVVDISNTPLLGKLKEVEKNAVVYPAKDEKYAVTVFFDHSCHFCKKMHKNIDGYNKRGITVRYLAFPRAGLNSKIARQMETVLSAENKSQAMHDLEDGKNIKESSKVSKVADQYNLGLQFGVQATPSIIFPDGSLHSGYLEPGILLEVLKEKGNI